MFPLKSAQPYPRRLWWVVALSEELGYQILARTILGYPIVLARDENGVPFAMHAYCPHRSFPFEMSKIVNGRMQCGYHGFEFNRNGQCVHVPTQSSVPTDSDVRTYPVTERDGLVWLWTGEPELADSALVLDAGSIGMGPGWDRHNFGLHTVKARYTLLIDNLMDLSHVGFIHAKTVPASGAVVMTEPTAEETSHSLLVKRRGLNLPPNPLSMALFPHHQGNYDQDFDAEFYTPALLRAVGDFFNSATGEVLGTYNVLNFITPETESSVHNWGIPCWNVELGNPAVGSFIKMMGDAIFPEDTVALEMVEAGLQRIGGEPREVSSRADTGALRVRHRIEKLIAAEMREPALAD